MLDYITAVLNRATSIFGASESALDALDRSQAVIYFKPDGTILTANDNFLAALGYSLSEIKGQHHRMFVEPEYATSEEYKQFWKDIGGGKFKLAEYKRITKSGKPIYIQATYNPIFKRNGQVYRVVKFATDITATVLERQRLENEKLTVIDNITKVSSAVANAAAEIATGNLNLSERTEAQAANIEETTATMQQITEHVRDNAKSLQHALEIALTTQATAKEGNQVVRSAVSAMSQIQESAEKINEIIAVIDEIAFQTNLLALNAAVEAARAGDQGRGFAVVASEVRALAARSGDAAKEIKDLITESVARVRSGTTEVNRTGEHLKGIVDSVHQVSDMMTGIANASAEQASGIEEINRAIAQMDQFTQQNAALVEEAASASQSLQTQSNELQKLITLMKE